MKPKPVITHTICSECGLDWERHGDTPTQSDCIRLLRADLASRPSPIINYPIPIPVPRYAPYIQPYRQWWQTTSAPINVCASNVTTMTPAINSTACNAVPS